MILNMDFISSIGTLIAITEGDRVAQAIISVYGAHQRSLALIKEMISRQVLNTGKLPVVSPHFLV